jgi:hypothetical protein
MDELSQKRFDTLIKKTTPELTKADKEFLRSRSSYFTKAQKELFWPIFPQKKVKLENTKK